MPQNRPSRFSGIGPTTPLREVRLGNFKSVRKAAVELRPLTVIVGRNSSGKSTLLQGILALAQAVRREVATQTFPLNGDLVRLGTFDEVRNFDVEAEAGIDIGFSAEIDYRGWSPSRGFGRVPATGTVKWDAHLTAQTGDPGSGQAALNTIEFAVSSTSGDTVIANISLDISSIEDSPEMQSMSIGGPVMLIGRDFPNCSIDGRITDLKSGNSSPVDRAKMLGGLPVRVFRTDTRFNVLFRLWWETAFDLLEAERHQARRETAQALEIDESRTRIREELRKAAKVAIEFARDCLVPGDESGEEALAMRGMIRTRRISSQSAYRAFFADRISRENGEKRLKIANAMNDLSERGFGDRLREALVKVKADWLDSEFLDEPTTDLHQTLDEGTLETYSLFRHVSYLGPLRAKPQVMYSPGIGQVDLGPEGEFSAAYLHANATRRVLVPLPAGGGRQMPLGAGLNLWLDELGLADAAAAKDRGRLGIGLYVQPIGRQQSVDLTSVGVGVSQALPVVLLCLLATPGSIVLIEQPELHLHPAMQLKLADFLLACSRSGRQIVIETHSEHIINRLRLRVAADETSATASIVRLLFAEQENGETLYRISDINEVGGLSTDWPKGFLDVSAEESTRLLQQSLAKKRSRSEKQS